MVCKVITYCNNTIRQITMNYASGIGHMKLISSTGYWLDVGLINDRDVCYMQTETIQGKCAYGLKTTKTIIEDVWYSRQATILKVSIESL